MSEEERIGEMDIALKSNCEHFLSTQFSSPNLRDLDDMAVKVAYLVHWLGFLEGVKSSIILAFQYFYPIGPYVVNCAH
ncbi:hypothetical protein TSUD_351710 [Trifolium subterraneum]|uniref:Uncharacterized protein n=1 Tax=Trifolium subterraneum TaxID=3900 RepID=A0A2Z6NVS3_TRISU|nr:hypothetical protein TSUD_351710 [Trifolium subterraneum]